MAVTTYKGINMEFTEEKTDRIMRADKAYNNREFLHSRDGRIIRIISEYLYPEQYFRKYGIVGTIVFYGSARTLSKEEFNIRIKGLNDKLSKAISDDEKSSFLMQKKKLENSFKMTEIYEESVELAEMLAKWGMKQRKDKELLICTGGGPGMMEAANRGAKRAGAKSIGLNISLPFEQFPNNYITPDLNFEFHYFFMRKFWFTYYTKAIIGMPGGFGTLDEMMEILTLIQTRKVTKKIPIILYNEDFWRKLINFEFLVESGMISEQDLNLFKYANSPKEAFDYLTNEIEIEI